MKKVKINFKAYSRKRVKLNEIYVAPLPRLQHELYGFSFFSGVGGLDKGARRALFQPLIQADFWSPAGRAFQANIDPDGSKGIPEYLKSEGIYLSGDKIGNIENLKFEILAKLVRKKLKIDLKPGDLTVIHGGPPCQDVSKANNFRKVFTKKNRLIFELLRLIGEAKPKIGLIEQVPDLLSDRYEALWIQIKLVLNSMTDYVWDYKVMNAMNYGARQNRKRVIIMLVRKDLGVLPSFPKGSDPVLSKVAVQSLLPNVYHFSPGQYADGIKSAHDNVFCTMTATGSEWFYGLDGKKRKPTLQERLVLTELEGLQLTGISETNQKKLVGNMVQVSLAEAIFKHIKREILKIPDEEGSNDLSSDI